MAENLVFLSGPQGGGKTTLSRILQAEDVLVPELETKTISLDAEPAERMVLKICQRSLENYEYLQIARANPGKIVIGNRCVYDHKAFNEAYFRRGWIDEETKKTCDMLVPMHYIEGLQEPWAIVLNPGFNVVQKHLKKRWGEGEKKWREEDSEYIRLACEAYEELRGHEKVLYIDHKIDLNSERDVREIRDWMDMIREGALIRA